VIMPCLHREGKAMSITPESSTVLSGHEWLELHDRRRRSKTSPRFELYKERQLARRKAKRQEAMQQRRSLAAPLLKGVQ
jgi:hypothetical protein